MIFFCSRKREDNGEANKELASVRAEDIENVSVDKEIGEVELKLLQNGST